MERSATILANVDNFGRIYRCGDCDNIHLQVGPVTVLLSVEAYMQFVALVNTSAANFESTLSCSRGGVHDEA